MSPTVCVCSPGTPRVRVSYSGSLTREPTKRLFSEGRHVHPTGVSCRSVDEERRVSWGPSTEEDFIVVKT